MLVEEVRKESCRQIPLLLWSHAFRSARYPILVFNSNWNKMDLCRQTHGSVSTEPRPFSHEKGGIIRSSLEDFHEQDTSTSIQRKIFSPPFWATLGYAHRGYQCRRNRSWNTLVYQDPFHRFQPWTINVIAYETDLIDSAQWKRVCVHSRYFSNLNFNHVCVALDLQIARVLLFRELGCYVNGHVSCDHVCFSFHSALIFCGRWITISISWIRLRESLAFSFRFLH